MQMFEKINYIVGRLDGDYAYLNQLLEDETMIDSSKEEKCVARALLPVDIEEGSKLVYEMLEYTKL